MSTAVLNVKINSELKERIRHYAEDNSETLSSVTEKLLLNALNAQDNIEVDEQDIDSQHTQEENTPALTDKEIKALRKLLKKRK
ncbi:hypothetical protein [Atlantibacter subterraneus]|jgi:predicted DNA binding protein|uniref:Arc family DNA-binding protein n=1 Tax=Atlantibacter subterraneus TaxID=255519 RepID=A0A427UVR4_9ENTR|nr:hypothetical protein [Atlantibacter subterranea]QFH70376.1 hypothetical protein FR762_11790 [Enterobacter sp. E76]MDA3132584.1 hypothetical protein [Atlantibacter subterranea]RSB61610.1 hypothetical protein EGK67_13760 [Atlantibacter subterranea]RSE04727.1 hypothetical protein EGT84_13460 [Atlantibacter subterranea]RSE24544.1 hypothetical protein EGT71_15330 [Atlantibacter subterranea]